MSGRPRNRHIYIFSKLEDLGNWKTGSLLPENWAAFLALSLAFEHPFRGRDPMRHFCIRELVKLR